MNIVAKTTLSAIAGAMLIAGVSSASAAPTIRIAPVETTKAVEVGFHGHRRHHWGHGYGYGYGYRHCFWKKKRFWGYYGPYWQRVKVCFH